MATRNTKQSKVRRSVQRLRATCWAVVALAVLHATQTPATTAPGGATLGLILAAALATALRLTRGTRHAARTKR